MLSKLNLGQKWSLKKIDDPQEKKLFISTIVFLFLWLFLVIYTATHHELFRDEMRVLSQVRQANSIFDLYNIIQYDGHPVLWFVILFIGNLISKSPLVLPIAALVVSFIAVTIVMLYSPFPVWFKGILICSFPLYEYTVMVRDYGLSMLFIFLAALLYEKRKVHPYWLALTLAFLANTTVISAIISGLFVLLWILDTFFERDETPLFIRLRSIVLPTVIVIFGIILCAFFTFPRENSIVTSLRNSFTISTLWQSIINALIHPETIFDSLFLGTFPKWLSLGLFILAILGLVRQPNLFLAAISGQIALGVLFQLAYKGGYRHQGLFIMFLISLYWIYTNKANKDNRALLILNKTGLYLAVGLMIAIGAVYSIQQIQVEIAYERSSNKAFGAFLNQSDVYRDAIIVPEPDFLLESLPYYAQNKIFFRRENRFGTTVAWTTEAETNLSIQELLATAQFLKTQYNRPVLIVLGHSNIDKTTDQILNYSYNKEFTWTKEEFVDFDSKTTLIANFDQAISDENYVVYEVR